MRQSLSYMSKNDLSKSMYQAVMKALGSKPANAHAANHIVEDIKDSNMLAQTPPNHIPAGKENVLNKDVSVSEMHQQKQANAQAAVGMPPKAPAMKKVGFGAMMVNQDEGVESPQERGLDKLKKFMEKSTMKKSGKAFDRASHKDIKGVHTSGGFSGLEEEGRSQAGNEITSRAPKAGNQYLKEMHHERGKEMHREKIKELKEMPKPKLPK